MQGDAACISRSRWLELPTNAALGREGQSTLFITAGSGVDALVTSRPGYHPRP